jgi:hypothetical protein
VKAGKNSRVAYVHGSLIDYVNRVEYLGNLASHVQMRLGFS